MTVALSHPERVYWPATGTTKAELAAYLRAIAPVLLPHLRDRGLTLRRFPDGVEGKSWYQAQCRGRPPSMRTQDVLGARGESLRYCIVDDVEGLEWLANIGCLELHPFLAPVDRPGEPAVLVVDLDPGPPSGVVAAAAVALRVLAILDGLGLPACTKVSGARGVHVLVPLADGHTFEETKAGARALAARLARETPDLVTATAARHDRRARVLVDWLQDDPTRSTVAVYSPRATPVPLVSAPVTREELEAAVAADRPDRLRFGFAEMLARVERDGDLFAPLFDRATAPRLPPADAFG